MSADQDNPLLFDVLTGSSSSYTANPDEQTLTEVKNELIWIAFKISFLVSSNRW